MRVLQSKYLLDQGFRVAIFSLLAFLGLPSALPSEAIGNLVREACYKAVQQRETKSLWSYRVERHENDHIILEQVIETVDAPVTHLLAFDGHAPTLAQLKEEEDRYRSLLKNSANQSVFKKEHDEETKKMAEMLRIVPEAFVFQDQGAQRGLEKIAFHPNPDFNPMSNGFFILWSERPSLIFVTSKSQKFLLLWRNEWSSGSDSWDASIEVER